MKEEQHPAISVVAPTYRRPRLLAELLESLVAQTLPSERFEVIIVDDGSGDETLDVLAQWRAKGVLQLRFESQENSGPAAARNRGFRMARAPLVAFIDDDCAAEPGWLEAHLAFMRTHPEIGGVGGKIVRKHDNLLARFVDHVSRMQHKAVGGEVMILITANACYPKAVLEEVDGFDERIPWPEGEDVDLARKVRESGRRLVVCDEAVVRHTHRDSLRGIYKDGTLSGIGHRYRMSMGLAERESRARTSLGMLKNHLLRALRAPSPLGERLAFAWFSLFKVAGYLAGARTFLRTKSSGQGRTLKQDLGATNLKGSNHP